MQPGKPTQNAHAESFHGRLREECLRVSLAPESIRCQDYNEQRPGLNYRTPAEFARETSCGKDVGSAHLENVFGVTPAAAG
jgi:putative transposase